ncbi:DNA-binding LytR/AlgR family response regulator [Paenibacillus sp. PastM-3]|uniref:hypothetical protein n=1 Tax=unclassified Paenibacillus TaxID=185978 RepID=UPI00240660A9|nr:MULTISPECIES: hypothetical protein [unclassified Paenibacillus]MDF9846819.1 DNA-binding LytR/AlgR family response regulator [Paenibacillus sp. PastM-2]MDH6479122.1 DNA-binding LytR/AlgR family response regulator [Paenibacillus sp. PastH-2]MDH6506853.1 DNA-binding LytR/AlgR family response regulator [Paenibacillus sp. PastM-3]
MIHRLQTDSLVLLGYQNERVHRIRIKDIYYFEAVDGKVFIYAAGFFDYFRIRHHHHYCVKIHL